MLPGNAPSFHSVVVERVRLAFTILAAGLALVGCKDPTSAPAPPAATASATAAPPPVSAAPSAGPVAPGEKPPATREGGAVSRSPSGDVLYVAHEDLGVVHAVPIPATGQTPRSITMPGPPAAVLALDGLVLVTIRDPGLLVAMRPEAAAGLVEVGRAELPADAWGLAITPDHKTAVVTSAWTHKVSGVDIASMKKRWSLDVAREPRGVVARPDGRGAYVTHLTRAALTRIDGIDGAEPSVRDVAFPAAPLRTEATYADQATLGYAVALSPSADRLYVPRQALAAKGVDQWNGYATVDILLVGDESPLAVPSKRTSAMWSKDFQERFGNPNFGGMFLLKDPSITGPGPTQRKSVFVQPRAAIYRASMRTLLVASEGEDTLVELDATSIDPSLSALRTYDLGAYESEKMATRCGAPTGVALSADERTAYVFCRSTHTLATVALDLLDAVGGEPPKVEMEFVSLAAEPLDEQAALGRRLFFNGRDVRMSGGSGCAGCHPEGRDDGHVWHQEEQADEKEKTGIRSLMMHSVELQNAYDAFLGTPRQTPMLAGRVSANGPYGWKGESPSFKHRALMGFVIHRWGGWDAPGGADERIKQAEAIVAFARKGLRTPPVDTSPLTKVEEYGKKLFNDPAVGCATCHKPETEYTDRAVYDLGPLPGAKGRFDKEIDWKFKTPSLLFIGGTAPYLHDGGVPTLEALIEQNGDRMGRTKQLNPDQRAALVAFLKRL